MKLTDALAGAAKGAAAGAAGATVGGLGGLVVEIAPEVGRWLFGGAGQQTAGLVARAVEAATGVTSGLAPAGMMLTHGRAAGPIGPPRGWPAPSRCGR